MEALAQHWLKSCGHFSSLSPRTKQSNETDIELDIKLQQINFEPSVNYLACNIENKKVTIQKLS